jgi:hypothetical protein
MRVATGSAHHRPNSMLSSNPASNIADKYVQNSVCLASACMAALPRARPTFRFARESNGMTAKETHARMIPGMLCSGALRPKIRCGFVRNVTSQPEKASTDNLECAFLVLLASVYVRINRHPPQQHCPGRNLDEAVDSKADK